MRDELSELMRASGPKLLARAVRLTRNKADAWDLLQDSLVRVLTRCPERSSVEGIKRWLAVTMRNLSTDRHRASRRYPRVDLSDGTMGVDPSALAEEPVWRTFDFQEVETCLALLEPQLREAYRLRVEQQLSLAEAARALGVPIATVGTRVHRARKKLRNLLLTGVHRMQKRPGETGEPLG